MCIWQLMDDGFQCVGVGRGHTHAVGTVAWSRYLGSKVTHHIRVSLVILVSWGWGGGGVGGRRGHNHAVGTVAWSRYLRSKVTNLIRVSLATLVGFGLFVCLFVCFGGGGLHARCGHCSLVRVPAI